jgi:hypothetical protein
MRFRFPKARGRKKIKMAEEKSKKRAKEEQNTEDESEDEMIGPLPVQASKPKKKKGISILDRRDSLIAKMQPFLCSCVQTLELVLGSE